MNSDDHDLSSSPSLLSTPGMSEHPEFPPSSSEASMSHRYDDLPDLQSVSDSDSDMDPADIQALSDDDMPGLESISHPGPTASTAGTSTAASPEPEPSASSRRRARVEDDEDNDRDRRHPSQRVGSPIDQHITNPLPPPPPPPIPAQQQQQQQQRRFFATPRVRATINFPAFFRTVVTGPDAFRIFQQQQQGNPNQLNPNAPPPFMNAPQTFLGGVAMSINLNGNNGVGVGNAQPHPHGEPQPGQGAPNPNSNPDPNPNANPPRPDGHRPFDPNDLASVRQFFNFFQNAVENFGFDREREPEDPERAKKLIDALEEVPVGLVRRLERVGGSADREKGGEETGAVGGDVGCAICWDKLLDGDGEGWGVPTEENHATTATPEHATPSTSADTLVASSSTPSAATDQNETLKEAQPADQATRTHPKIVSLPCAHVFHASCLVPWFSRPRQTTCPTCRFNIDPENLTYVRRRRTPRAGTNNPTAPTAATATANPPASDAGQPGGTDAQTQQQPAMVIIGGPGAPPQVFPWNMQPAPNPQPQPANPTPPIDPSAAAPPRQEQEQTQAQDPAAAAHPDPTVQALLASGGGVRAAIERVAEARRGVAALEGFLREQLERRMGGGEPDLVQEGEGAMAGEGEERGFTFGDVMDMMGAGGPPPPPPPPGPPMQGENVPTAPASENGDDDPPLMPLEDPAGERDVVMDEAGEDSDARNNNPNADGGAEIEGFVTIGFDVVLGAPEGMDFATMFGGPRTQGQAAGANATPDSGAPANGNVNPGMEGNTTTGAPGPTPPPGWFREAAETVDAAMESLFGGPRTEEERLAQGQGQGQGPPPAQQGQGQQQQQPGGPPFRLQDLLRTMFGNPLAGANAGRMQQGVNGAGGVAGIGVPGAGGQAPPPPPATVPNVDPNAPAAAAATEGEPNTEAGTNGTNGNAAPNPPRPVPIWQDLLSAVLDAATNGTGGAGGGPPPPWQARPPPPAPRPPKTWTLPAPPGPTLRQRVEKKEREAGLRCHDLSCGVGPSDEDPFVGLTEEAKRQVSIVLRKPREEGVDEDVEMEEEGVVVVNVCPHTFHAPCLVSAARLSMMGVEAASGVEGYVEVACSVCRGVGSVRQGVWEEGVTALA